MTTSGEETSAGTRQAPEPYRVCTDIPGVVLHVHVAAGDRIEVGATVAELESMKMEIPVIAERPGVVADVLPVPGATVRVGDVIAVLTSADDHP